MSATDAIKDALIVDVATISGIGTVSKEPVPPELIDYGTTGAFYIGSSEGADSLDSFNDDRGIAEQSFFVELATRSDATPNQEADDFLDAFRNVVEKSGSAVRAVVGSGVVAVEQATVTAWGGVESAEAVAAGVYIRDAEITVVYYYERGSV